MAKSLFNIISESLSESLEAYFQTDDTFILGVSGGADSMALLYLFYRLKRKGTVVHLNYQQRDEASDLDQELVEQMAFQWGFECCTVHPDLEDATGENFQKWARDQRYDVFKALRKEQNAAAVVTAHHQDDQVETILQKILRGSGPSAWQGMQLRDEELFRPLLPFPKEQILELCEAESIPYRTDESNLSSHYARNFLRREWSDKMDDLFPGWRTNILTMAEYGTAFDAAMEWITEQVAPNDTIDLNAFTELPESLQPAVLKVILDRHGTHGNMTRGQLQELAKLKDLQTGKVLKTESLSLVRDRDKIRVQKERKQEPFHVHEQISREAAGEGLMMNGMLLIIRSAASELPHLSLDESKLNWPLTFRNWEAGDMLHPLGMKGTQKVSDHLTNRKVPAPDKEKALVLCGSDGTIYAIIYPQYITVGSRSRSDSNDRGAVAEPAKYEPSTDSFLTINFI